MQLERNKIDAAKVRMDSFGSIFAFSEEAKKRVSDSAYIKGLIENAPEYSHIGYSDVYIHLGNGKISLLIASKMLAISFDALQFHKEVWSSKTGPGFFVENSEYSMAWKPENFKGTDKLGYQNIVLQLENEMREVELNPFEDVDNALSFLHNGKLYTPASVGAHHCSGFAVEPTILLSTFSMYKLNTVALKKIIDLSNTSGVEDKEEKGLEYLLEGWSKEDLQRLSVFATTAGSHWHEEGRRGLSVYLSSRI